MFVRQDLTTAVRRAHRVHQPIRTENSVVLTGQERRGVRCLALRTSVSPCDRSVTRIGTREIVPDDGPEQWPPVRVRPPRGRGTLHPVRFADALSASMLPTGPCQGPVGDTMLPTAVKAETVDSSNRSLSPGADLRRCIVAVPRNAGSVRSGESL